MWQQNEEAAESEHLHVGKGGTCHMVSQLRFPSVGVAKQQNSLRADYKDWEFTLDSHDTSTARVNKQDEVNVKW